MRNQVCLDTDLHCVCSSAFCDGEGKFNVCLCPRVHACVHACVVVVIIVAAASVETGKANSVFRNMLG